MPVTEPGGLPESIGRFAFPPALLWFGALSTSAMGAVLLVGAPTLVSDTRFGARGAVMVAAVALSFLAVSAILWVGMLLRPRRDPARLAAAQEPDGGIVLAARRRGDVTLAIATGTFTLTAVIGGGVATGGWRIGAWALAATLALTWVASLRALARPRRLRLTSMGIESLALRSHTTATWQALASARLSLVSGAGGQMLARLSLPAGIAGFEQRWHSPFEVRRDAVDVEYAMTGVDGGILLRLIADAIAYSSVRTRIDSDRDAIVLALADPAHALPWHVGS